MKVCTKCKVEKEFIYFYKQKSKKNGYQSSCKECCKSYNLKNKDCQKEYRLNNKERYKEYYINNKEYKKKYQKEYNLNNSDKIKENRKQYHIKNKEVRNKYKKDRRLTDPLFKLSGNIRSLISICVKNQGYKKNSKTSQILGCSFEDFKTHLENQFTEGMNWSNAGKWQLDHIYPVSLARDEQHLIKLNHYTNFQPLWAIDNLRKSNKITNNTQLS